MPLLSIAMWFFKSRSGNMVGLGIIGVMAFAAYTAWVRNDATSDALREREAEIKEINDAFVSKARNARDSARLCRAADGVWNFADARCEPAGEGSRGR